MHRAIASLSITFGLVSIPVKLYSATDSSEAVRFKWMAASGERVRQQYVADVSPAVVQTTPEMEDELPRRERGCETGVGSPEARKPLELSASREIYASPPPKVQEPAAQPVLARAEMLKGYEYEKGKFALFTTEELKALEAGSRKTIDIVAFVPLSTVDSIYYDKAYYLAPDKRGAKPYNLLLHAMRDTERCGLAKWAFRSKEYVVLIRPADGGMVLQQLLYADEVRALKDLRIESAEVGEAELKLAKQLIAQISADFYDPTAFVDEEKQRILAAVAEKIAGKPMGTPTHAPSTGQVVDLLQALRGSLIATPAAKRTVKTSNLSPAERKPAKRAASRRDRSVSGRTRSQQ